MATITLPETSQHAALVIQNIKNGLSALNSEKIERVNIVGGTKKVTLQYSKAATGTYTNVDAAITGFLTNVSYNATTGDMTFNLEGGTNIVIPLGVRSVITDAYYDSSTQELVMLFSDGQEVRIPVADLIDEYYADNVTLELYQNAGQSTFRVKALGVGTNQLATSAVTTAKIATGAVTANELASNAVTTVKILNGNVTTEKIADNAVNINKISDGSISTAKLQDQAVTMIKIAHNSIDSERIQMGAVHNGHLQNAVVTTEKIADGAVTNTKIATGAIDKTKFINGNPPVTGGPYAWGVSPDESMGGMTMEDWIEVAKYQVKEITFTAANFTSYGDGTYAYTVSTTGIFPVGASGTSFKIASAMVYIRIGSTGSNWMALPLCSVDVLDSNQNINNPSQIVIHSTIQFAGKVVLLCTNILPGGGV